jgi:multisubunit Na+/H+ antiporter MnhB subunit
MFGWIVCPVPILEAMVMEWVPIVLAVFKGTALLIGMVYAIKWHYEQDKKARAEGSGLQSPTEMRLFLTMILALAVSIIGIVWAGCWGNAADGGYGGALGCALAFIMAFMAKPEAKNLAQAQVAPADPENLDDALMQLVAVKAALAHAQALHSTRMEAAWREKIYLGVAGAVSALIWKFGAVAAGWLNFGY